MSSKPSNLPSGKTGNETHGRRFTVLTIVGARPQFVKSAMLSKEIIKHGEMTEVLVHTGQHYDERMSAIFFEEMGIPEPKYNLEVGSQSHAKQTAAMLERLDSIYETVKPDATIVYGDTNSTLAGALASIKHRIPVIHIEAGMRSEDRYQPEQINRVLTDHASELFLCSSHDSVANLAREGITTNVFVTGDIMHDSTITFSHKTPEDIPERYGVKRGAYVLATIHRAESTDNAEHLRGIVNALVRSTAPIIFPIHPRTRKLLHDHGLWHSLAGAKHIHVIEPVGYTEMLGLVKHATRVITDSGGLQKEAYFLHVPCIMVRDETEWVELVHTGWNRVVGYDSEKILQAITDFTPPAEHPELFGDGHAAHNIHTHIVRFLDARAHPEHNVDGHAHAHLHSHVHHTAREHRG